MVRCASFFPLSVAISDDDRIFVSQDIPAAVNVFSMSGLLLGTLIYPEQGLEIIGLAYSAKLNRIFAADNSNNQVVTFSAVPPPGRNASLCVILYGLPGTVDYPWSERRTNTSPYAAPLRLC